MTTAIQCVEQMVDDYLRAELSIDQFTRKWQGSGGRRHQQNGLDFANINPCPQHFETGLLFVPVTGGYDGSLEFYLRPEAKLTLSDLVASYGARSQAVNVPKAELFRIARLDHAFNATLIARFERENPLPGDRPVQLIFQKEPR